VILRRRLFLVAIVHDLLFEKPAFFAEQIDFLDSDSRVLDSGFDLFHSLGDGRALTCG
jgi:hypothetical protein